MAKINTKELLIKYIRSRLGEPIITVELTNEQLEYIIEETIVKFSEFAYDGQDIRVMIIPIFDNIKEYKLDNRISSVIDLRVSRNYISGGVLSGLCSIPAGYSPIISGSMLSLSDFETSLVNISRLDNLFNIRPNFNFNSNNSVISFTEDMNGHNAAIIEVALEYEPGEIDGIYNHPWIKDMCVAQSKVQWGGNIGKYSGTLINGNTINYSDIKSEGQTDIDRLNEELLTRWSPPLGITVG